MAHGRRKHPPRSWRIRQPFMPWFGFLGGGAAWAIHLTLAYALVEVDCRSERLAFELFGLPALHVLGILLTVLAAATALAAAWTALVQGAGARHEEEIDPVEAHESYGRTRFMGYTGLILNGFFTIAILAGGAGFLWLRACS